MSEILNTNGQPVNGDGSAELLKPNGQPVHPPEPELDNLSKAIIALYEALTEDQKAILSIGMPLVAVLTQTAGTSGLNIKIEPARPCRVDHALKKVFILEQNNAEGKITETGGVSPERGNAAVTGAEGEAETRTVSGDGEGAQG